MPLTRLAERQWQAYFDRVSKGLGAKRVLIEVTGLGLGHQVEAEWIALVGLPYDGKDDVLVIMGEALRHVISRPREVHVDQELDSLQSVEVVDADGNHHIVLLKDPLSLPAA